MPDWFPASAPGHDIEIVAGTVDNPEMQAYLKRNEVDLPPIMGQWEAFQIRKLGKSKFSSPEAMLEGWPTAFWKFHA